MLALLAHVARAVERILDTLNQDRHTGQEMRLLCPADQDDRRRSHFCVSFHHGAAVSAAKSLQGSVVGAELAKQGLVALLPSTGGKGPCPGWVTSRA